MVYGGCLYDIQRVSGWYLEGVYRYLNGAYIVSKGQVRTRHNSIPTCIRSNLKFICSLSKPPQILK